MGEDTHSGSRRILFLISDMQSGGAERVAATLCNSWVGKGFEVTLMPIFSGRGQCGYLLDPRVNLEYLADRVRGGKNRFIQKLSRFIALRKAFRELEPDVVISFLSTVNIVTLFAAKGLGLRTVVSERVYPPTVQLGVIWDVLRKWSYPWANLVVAQTKETSDWMKNEYRINNTVVIPNPIDFPVSRTSPALNVDHWVASKAKVILAAGRLVEQKGFDVLIKAFSRVAAENENWQLIILGEGELRTELGNLSKALNLGSQVHFPGWAGNIADWYQRADIFVLSSRFEGFPNTLLEAMAYGLPVVSFDCESGPADIIRNKNEGVLIPKEKGADGLASALEALMESEVQRHALGRNAEQVRSRYSLEQISEQWLEALELR